MSWKHLAVRSVQDWYNLIYLCRFLVYQLAEAKLKENIGLSENANDIMVVIINTHFFML